MRLLKHGGLMRKLVALAVLVLLGAMFAAAPASAGKTARADGYTIVRPAAGSDDFAWGRGGSDDRDGWIDVACLNGGTGWKVTFYKDANLQSYWTRICSNTPGFCNFLTHIPLYGPGISSGFCLGAPYEFAFLNDNANSAKWDITAGWCISMYSDDNYGGSHQRMFGNGYSNSLGSTVGNDQASSVKRVGDDKC